MLLNFSKLKKNTNVLLIYIIAIQGVYDPKIKVESFKSHDLLDFISTKLPALMTNNRKYIFIDNTSIYQTLAVR